MDDFAIRISVIIGVLALVFIFNVVRSLLDDRARRRALRRLMEAQQQARSPQASSIVPPQNWQSTLTVQPGSPTSVRSSTQGVATAAPPAPRPSSAIPTLDLATFAPMSDAQVKAAAQGLVASGVNLFQTFRFGLRSQIPPATDPRTLLIDKAMVAHGLLTPEDLLDIHRIGDAMDEVKPALENIHARAENVVRQSVEDKKRVKEQKKAEAAERKRLHAEAVARRRATDIIHLGRGVSKGLADRRADVEKLTAAGLPILATPADVAEALKLDIPTLRWLAFHTEAAATTHYVRFTVPKRSGGVRHLFAPHEKLATAQEWVLRNILDKVPTHAAAHGFVRGRSTVTNAAEHVNRAIVLNTDLENFFPTIAFPRVLGIFKQLGYSPAAATILALLCTESPRRPVTYAGKPYHVATGPRALPQGACTSPALSNLASRRLDSRLTGIARKLGYTYTRYADDLTFSRPDGGEAVSAAGSSEHKVGYLLARIRHIAQDEGFTVNEPKTRVLKRAARQEVTGIVVNERPGVPRPLYKRLRAILHRAKHEGLAAQNHENRPNFEAWLEGMIAYVTMVNQKQGQALAAAFAEVAG
jgi:retron-type reverse transcriptase